MALTEDQARAAVARLSRNLLSRRPKIDDRIAYFKGTEGRLRFASEQFRDYFRMRFAGFCDNWCMPVGQAPAERMTPVGIRLDSESKRADQDLQRVWLANGADRGVSEAFQVFIVASRAFALVSPNPRDESTPRITFEHPSQAIVEYDPETGERRFGLVTWSDDQRDYATLYTPDEMWRYWRKTGQGQGEATATQPTPLDGWEPRDVDPNPAPHKLGAVPLVEFRNQELLDDEPLSDIDGVMAMQDSINLVWAYLINALDYASLPQRVVLGGEIPKVPILDSNGQKVGERPVELDELIHERIMFIPGRVGANVSIGEWTAAQLNVFSEVIERAVEHIAAQTRTPPHYLIARMVNTSAESLAVAEAGLVSKTQERITYATPALREIYRLVALAQGDEAKARAAAAGEIIWKDVQYRSEAQRADALIKKRQAGYPLEYILELDGVPPWDIPRIMEMARREQADPSLEAIAESLSSRSV